MFLGNVGWLSPDYTALDAKRLNFSQAPPWEPQIRTSLASSNSKISLQVYAGAYVDSQQLLQYVPTYNKMILWRFWGCVNIDGVWFGWIRFNDHLYIPVGTTLYRSLTYTETELLSLLQFPLAVSLQLFLPREIFQLPALRSSCHSRQWRTSSQLTIQLTRSQAGGYFTPAS
jgi:hypothetical protein